jgi:hypothetical protein
MIRHALWGSWATVSRHSNPACGTTRSGFWANFGMEAIHVASVAGGIWLYASLRITGGGSPGRSGRGSGQGQ